MVQERRRASSPVWSMKQLVTQPDSSFCPIIIVHGFDLIDKTVLRIPAIVGTLDAYSESYLQIYTATLAGFSYSFCAF